MRPLLAALLTGCLTAAAPGVGVSHAPRHDLPSSVVVLNRTGRDVTVEACPEGAACAVLGFLRADSTGTYGVPRPAGSARVVLYGKSYFRYGAYVVAARPLDPAAAGVARVTLVRAAERP